MINDLKTIHDHAREDNIPIMKDDGMAFLLDYIRNHENIRDILECGTAVGYSSINMANIRWDMQIDTIEVDPEMYKQALLNIESQNLQGRIHCHLCDAAELNPVDPFRDRNIISYGSATMLVIVIPIVSYNFVVVEKQGCTAEHIAVGEDVEDVTFFTRYPVRIAGGFQLGKATIGFVQIVAIMHVQHERKQA